MELKGEFVLLADGINKETDHARHECWNKKKVVCSRHCTRKRIEDQL